MAICSKCGLSQEDNSFCIGCGDPLPSDSVRENKTEETISFSDHIEQSNTSEVNQAEAEALDYVPEILPSAAVADQPAAEPEILGSPKTVYCVKCGNRLPQDGQFCAVCGTKAAEVLPSEEIIPVSQPYYPQDAFSMEQNASQPAKGSGKKTLGIAIATAVVLLICIGAFLFLQFGPEVEFGDLTIGGGSKKNADTDHPIIYLQDGDTLKYRTSSMDKSQTVTDNYSVKSEYDWIAEFYLHYMSEDGTYLLYLNEYRSTSDYFDGKGELYVRDLTELAEQGETNAGIKVDSDVSTEFKITPNNEFVLYINNKGDLYVWDFNESYKIDSDVAGIYDFSDTNVLYYKGDQVDDYTAYYSSRDCYVAPLTQDGRENREKIDTDINDLLAWNEDFSEFIYTKSYTPRGSDATVFDVYHYNLATDEKETMISEVDSVVEADIETGSVLFLRAQEASISFDDIIEDDMLEADALITEPDMADYPMLDQYYNDYNYSGYYEGDFDYEELELEFEQYDAAYAEYDAKLRRDRIRETLADDLTWSSATFEVKLYEMYYYTGGDRVKIDSDIYVSASSDRTEVYSMLNKGYVAYLKADVRDMGKLKLSEMESSFYIYDFDVEQYLRDNMVGELYVSFLNGTPAQLTSQDDEVSPIPYNVWLDEEGTGIYYEVEDLSVESNDSYLSSYNYDLYYAPVSGGSVGDSKLIDSNVQHFSYGDLYNGGSVYITGTKDDIGDLYTVKNGERERLAYDVSTHFIPEIYNDGQSLLFFENFDTNRAIGELYMMTGGEKIKINEDVYEYYYRSDDLIYLLCSYRSGKGDLYTYNGSSVSLVDYDVTTIMDPWYHYYES